MSSILVEIFVKSCNMARPKPKKWIPKNPDKYVGDHKNIVTRSSWESRTMTFFDLNESVVMWASEEFSVKYISPIDGMEHRYFVDFLVKIKNKSGDIKTYMVEVKPHHERFPPKPSRNKKKFLEQMQTYLVNQAKWKAAQAFCDAQGVHFIVLDEYDIGIKPRPTNV